MTAPAVWYLMRASGVVALLLLTTSLALGIATTERWRPSGARLRVTTMIHRNASLLAVAFLAVHVLTSVLDPDAEVRAVATIVPFGSAWPLAVGTLSLDLVVALVATSLARRRIGFRAWRLVHWSAYAAWPLAVGHGVAMGTDARAWWSALVTVGCIGVATGAASWRLMPVSRP
jgi:sulfoxide reductase heme-binding subunit YedZ